VPDRGAVPVNIEVEWQLDALDLRPVERWLAAFPRVVPGQTAGSNVVVTAVSEPVTRTVDTYLDTEDWRIGRSGFVLRIRHADGEDEVTLKDRTAAVAGLRRRIEVTEPLEADGLDGLGVDGPVGRRLRALVGEASLHHLLEVRTRRHPYRLHAANRVLGEIDLDDTIIVVGDDQYPVRMRRVEVEVDSGWVDVLTPLVDQLRHDCGLQSAILSKFEVGLLAAGLRVPEIPDLGPTNLPPGPSVGDVAYAVMRRNLAAMLAHEAGTRLGEDIEELHDMRVATRRLRAALALFEGVLPSQARRLRSEFGWLAGELGAVRDLDVQIDRLDSWRDELPDEDRGALTDLGRLLDRERDGARERLLLSLDSPRYERLVSEFTSLLRLDPGQGSGRQIKAARAPAAAAVPGLIRARHRSAASAARRARRSGLPADYHRLRIRCKRLRYALEFVSEIYDGRTRGVVRRVVRLQDCLGLLQDSQVAVERLHALATESSELSPAAVFAMGGVAERYRREADRLLASLPGHLEAMRGRPWRKLKALMERRRLEAGPPHTWSPDPPEPNGSTADDDGSDHAPGNKASATWPTGSSRPRPSQDTTDDDPEWDDAYAPALRSVPVEQQDVDEPRPVDDPTPSDVPRSPVPAPAEPSVGRRRKEPVFLPAPPSAPRPAQGRPVPRAEPPPDDGRTRSFHHRP
jgi:CHAD domain-containing protein